MFLHLPTVIYIKQPSYKRCIIRFNFNIEKNSAPPIVFYVPWLGLNQKVCGNSKEATDKKTDKNNNHRHGNRQSRLQRPCDNPIK